MLAAYLSCFINTGISCFYLLWCCFHYHRDPCGLVQTTVDTVCRTRDLHPTVDTVFQHSQPRKSLDTVLPDRRLLSWLLSKLLSKNYGRWTQCCCSCCCYLWSEPLQYWRDSSSSTWCSSSRSSICTTTRSYVVQPTNTWINTWTNIYVCMYICMYVCKYVCRRRVTMNQNQIMSTH